MDPLARNYVRGTGRNALNLALDLDYKEEPLLRTRRSFPAACRVQLFPNRFSSQRKFEGTVRMIFIGNEADVQ